MTRTFDIKFIDDPFIKPVGYIVIKNSVKLPFIEYDCVTTGILTEKEIDDEVERLSAELEVVRKNAKKKLKQLKSKKTEIS
jgi:hypothetical protein